MSEKNQPDTTEPTEDMMTIELGTKKQRDEYRDELQEDSQRSGRGHSVRD